MTPQETVENLFEQYEHLDDIDYNNGILNIETDNGEYVINAHAPTNQVWLSSPVSGAHHFTYAHGEWVSTKDNSLQLKTLLAKELSS